MMTVTWPKEAGPQCLQGSGMLTAPPSDPSRPHPSIFPFFKIPTLAAESWGRGRGRGGPLGRNVSPHLAHPALHLLAEVVVPAAVGPEFRAVFASTHLVPLPVIGLSGRPVPRKAGRSSSSQPYPCHPHLRKAQRRRRGSGSRRSSLGGRGLGSLMGGVAVSWDERPGGWPQAKPTRQKEATHL